MRYAILALPAVLCSLVVAIPSPAAQDDPSLHLDQERQIPRWRTVTNRIIERVFGFDKKHGQKHAHLPKYDVPTHMFARYGGDLVLRFNISTNEEAESLAEAADTLLLDVWEFSQDWVDIRLDSESVPLLLGLLPARLQVSHTPLLREQALAEAIYDNYQRHSSRPPVESAAHVPIRKPFGPELEQETTGAETNIFFSDYQPFSVIEPWLRLLASLFTTHVRHINVGLSYEGCNIPALRVGVHPTNSEDPDPPKRKTIIVVGSLHAREWISTTTVNYLAYSLITGYGKLQSITNLLQDFDFVFIPTLNPDGYVYTWETDRLWRKNRQQTGIRFCQGIDLDRAFSFEWDDSGNPCSESYSGETAFEAVEAATFAEWAKNETENNNVDFVGFLDLHSYSQEILYPYSYSCSDTPPGLENLEEVAFGLGKAIRMTHSHSYEIMPACEGNVGALSSKDLQQKKKKNHLMPRIEPSGGSALDYFYHSLGVRYAYQIKLRDRGTYGFLLPKENIVPTGKEILNALLYFGGFLGELYDTDSKSVELVKPDLDTVEGEGEFALTEDEEEIEDDDDEPWILVEDVREPDDYNWDLRRRRRR